MKIMLSLSQIHGVIIASKDLETAAKCIGCSEIELGAYLRKFVYKEQPLTFSLMKSIALENGPQEFDALYTTVMTITDNPAQRKKDLPLSHPPALMTRAEMQKARASGLAITYTTEAASSRQSSAIPSPAKKSKTGNSARKVSATNTIVTESSVITVEAAGNGMDSSSNAHHFNTPSLPSPSVSMGTPSFSKSPVDSGFNGAFGLQTLADLEGGAKQQYDETPKIDELTTAANTVGSATELLGQDQYFDFKFLMQTSVPSSEPAIRNDDLGKELAYEKSSSLYPVKQNTGVPIFAQHTEIPNKTHQFNTTTIVSQTQTPLNFDAFMPIPALPPELDFGDGLEELLQTGTQQEATFSLSSGDFSVANNPFSFFDRTRSLAPNVQQLNWTPYQGK